MASVCHFYLCGTKIPLGREVCMESTLSTNTYFFVFLQLKDVAVYKNPYRHQIHQCNWSDSLHILHGVWPEFCPKLLDHITHHTSKKISLNSSSHLFHSNLGSCTMDLIPNCTKGITLKTSPKEQEQTLDVKEFIMEAGLSSCFLMREKQWFLSLLWDSKDYPRKSHFLWHNSLVVYFFT